jgi:L-serine deaminase
MPLRIEPEGSGRLRDEDAPAAEGSLSGTVEEYGIAPGTAHRQLAQYAGGSVELAEDH